MSSSSHHGRKFLVWLEPLRTALFLSVILGVLTAVYSLLRLGMGMVGMSKMKITFAQSAEWVISVGLFSFLLSLLGTFLFNLLAGFFGGLPIRVEDEESES